LRTAAGVSLNQDGTRYFDIHHTPDDTLAMVDKKQLQQNVAAWTASLAVLADRSHQPGATNQARRPVKRGRSDRSRAPARRLFEGPDADIPPLPPRDCGEAPKVS
jgi:hypothetical protein